MMVSQMECLSLNLEQEAEPSLYMGLPKFSKSKKEKKNSFGSSIIYWVQ